MFNEGVNSTPQFCFILSSNIFILALLQKNQPLHPIHAQTSFPKGRFLFSFVLGSSVLRPGEYRSHLQFFSTPGGLGLWFLVHIVQISIWLHQQFHEDTTGNLTFSSLNFHLRTKNLFNKAKIKKRSKLCSPNEALLFFLCYNCYPDAPLKLQRQLFFPTWTSLSRFLCLYFQTHSDSEEKNKKESIGKN